MVLGLPYEKVRWAYFSWWVLLCLLYIFVFWILFLAKGEEWLKTFCIGLRENTISEDCATIGEKKSDVYWALFFIGFTLALPTTISFLYINDKGE